MDDVPVFPAGVASMPGFIYICANANGCSSATLRKPIAKDTDLIVLKWNFMIDSL